MPTIANKETIVVALSGGVDSATTAGLLVEKGHRVVGITMRLYNAKGSESASGGRCCGPRDLEDARRVCAHLGIPFYVANYEDVFRQSVVDDFVAEYAAGRTPNPCIRCNQNIKFTPLLQRAKALGADKLATGHYARLCGPTLRRGVDPDKDQSYFLFAMPRAPEILFPLGGMSKPAVRAKAAALGLPNADKPESQEICFVPDGDYAGFVAAHTPEALGAGEIVDGEGRVLGHHPGVHHFTVGQRRGLGAVGAGEPRYVVSVDALTRRVRVGSKEDVRQETVLVAAVMWREGQPSERFRAHVQVRHRHRAKPAWVEPDRERVGFVRVRFDEPEPAIAPGQAAVFYDGDRVVGGGWIG